MTPIFVQGDHIVNASTLRCRIGERVVRGTYLSSQLVLCNAPPHAAVLMDHGWYSHGQAHTVDFAHVSDARTGSAPSSVFVEVSNNALDYTTHRVLVEYEGACPTGHYCLEAEAGAKFPCPRGAYCPGEGN